MRRADRSGESVGVQSAVPGDHLEGRTQGAAPVSGLGDMEDDGGTLWSGNPRTGFMG